MNIAYFCNDISDEMIFESALNNIGGKYKDFYVYETNDVFELFKKNAIDIIFINVSVIGEKALNICKLIKTHYNKTSVIIVSENRDLTLEAFDVSANGYILLPITEQNVQKEIDKVNNVILKKKNIFVKTFGYFDIFVNGDAVHFTNSKSKEFLALLIDLCGGTISMDQTIKYLWPERQNDQNVKSRYRGMLKDLRETLMSYDIYEIISEKRNSRSINRSFFTCDYYGLLRKDDTYIERFEGKYMSSYFWGKETLLKIDNLIKK